MTKRNADTMDDDSSVVSQRPAAKKPRDDAVKIKIAHLMKIAHLKEACEKRNKLTRDLEELEAFSQDYNKCFEVISHATYDAAAYLVSTFSYVRLIQKSSTHNTQAKYVQIKMVEIAATKKVAEKDLKDATEDVEACKTALTGIEAHGLPAPKPF